MRASRNQKPELEAGARSWKPEAGSKKECNSNNKKY